MFKSISLILLLLLSTEFTFSQSGWFRLHPDTAHYFTAIEFIGTDTGYAGTSAGTIQKTTNSGLSWSTQNSGSNQWIQEIHFINPNTGFYTGSQGRVFKTLNGGANWNPAGDLNTELFSVIFVNSFTGYVTGNQGAIFRTSDGGSSWLPQNSNTTEVLFSIFMLNPNTGYITGSFGKILRTTNGGINWIFQNSNVFNLLRSVYFIDLNTGYITGDNKVLKTTNSGLIWTTSTFSQHLMDIYFVSSNLGFAVGYDGTIINTTNGGGSWSLQNSGVSCPLLRICFSNASTGFAVGGEFESFGVILKTTSGGTIGIKPISNEVPDEFKLSQNYPNPFNPKTIISFSIPPVGNGRDRSVQLLVFDILGREVTTLVNEQLQPGTYEVDFDGGNFASGIYYYKLISGDYTDTKKLILIK
jgi:photosystem II stability/assembly factor-like uncharacterized protein